MDKNKLFITKKTVQDWQKPIARLEKWIISAATSFEIPNDEEKLKGYDYVNAQKITDNDESITQYKGFTQIPNPATRDALYVSGMTGSGKSYYTASYAREYQKMFPDNDIFLISKVKQDPAFDGLTFKRIDVDLFEDDDTNFDSEQFHDCLMIFDDIDQLPDKQRKRVTFLRDQILETGRHGRVYVVSTAHLLTNYKQSRILLNESTSVTFFPGGSWLGVMRYLKEYLGLPKEEISKIKNTKSRWITIFPTQPMVIMSQYKVWIPNKQ